MIYVNLCKINYSGCPEIQYRYRYCWNGDFIDNVCNGICSLHITFNMYTIHIVHIATHLPSVGGGAKDILEHCWCYGSSSLCNVVSGLHQCGNGSGEHTSFDKSQHKGVQGNVPPTSWVSCAQSISQETEHSETCEQLWHNDMVPRLAGSKLYSHVRTGQAMVTESV